MNEVFLIGKVISYAEFKFIVNSKKKKSIARFNLEIKGKQIIDIIAYNEKADFAYRKVKNKQYVFVNGKLSCNEVIAKEINIL